MAGALLSLFEALETGAALRRARFPGRRILFGEEHLADAGAPSPRIVMVPTSTSFGPPGTIAGIDPRVVWAGVDAVEFHLWAESVTPGKREPQHHADAVETLREAVIQAVHAQMWGGYLYRAVSGDWKPRPGEQAVQRAAYMLVVEAFVPICLEADTTVTPGTVNVQGAIT